MQVTVKQNGITLFECLIVLAIMAILSSMAMPSFNLLRDVAHQKRMIHQLHAAVLMARHRSVIDGKATYLCPAQKTMVVDMSSTPECGADYGSGVAIWSKEGGNWRLLRIWQWPRTKITNRRGNQEVSGHITFSARGLANRNITWSTCVDDRNLSLVLNRIGRPDVRSQWGEC